MKFIKFFDIIVVCGTNSKNFLKLKYNISDSKIFIKPNSIDIKKFNNQPDEILYDILFVGRIVPAKRIDIWINVIHKLKESKKDIRACIVGDGPLRSEMEKICNNKLLSDSIQFVGEKEDPSEYYHKSKIFLMTSAYEGLPLALVEAMASGLPSVVPDTGDISNCVINGYNSYLVKDFLDVNSYAKKIIFLLNNEIQYRNFSINARKTIEKYYSFDNAIQAWNNVFKEIKKRIF